MQGEEVSRVQKTLKLSNLAHRIIFFKRASNELCAILTMYGITHLILLSNKYSGTQLFKGFICDWENKKESLLIERITEIAKGQNNYIMNPLG